ncbi:hypothetical protein SDC9_183218 [bioreactor metagenome]|uniref:Uncharacterized protein n=1 Tax=bioreactor metagenome TaxID=1076179 RepID=A0A645HAI4_9ZZZZ
MHLIMVKRSVPVKRNATVNDCLPTLVHLGVGIAFVNVMFMVMDFIVLHQVIHHLICPCILRLFLLNAMTL